MKLWIVFVLFSAIAGLQCAAEPRWCSVTGRGPNDTLIYPPIARAARVSGVVVMRILYTPNGKVLSTEPVFGPVMLSSTLTSQLNHWILKTAATGDELCTTLVIADFRIRYPDEPLRPSPPQPNSSSILRLIVESEAIVISDPEGQTTGNPFRIFEYKLRRGVKRLFHTTS